MIVIAVAILEKEKNSYFRNLYVIFLIHLKSVLLFPNKNNQGFTGSGSGVENVQDELRHLVCSTRRKLGETARFLPT